MADKLPGGDQTPKTISKGTVIMVAAAVLFVIIAAILFTSFLKTPAGGTTSNSANTGALR